jgi:uncharacterized membrane protein HdeD (DUF308 family)
MAVSPKVRKGLGIFMICCGVFILGVSVLIGPSLNTLTGVIILIAGIINLTKKN